MTLEEVYNILESKIFYEKESMRKFSFVDNTIHIDRRALIPYSIFKENETFILDPDTPIAGEKQLRIEIGANAAAAVQFYGKTNGERYLTLE